MSENNWMHRWLLLHKFCRQIFLLLVHFRFLLSMCTLMESSTCDLYWKGTIRSTITRYIIHSRYSSRHRSWIRDAHWIDHWTSCCICCGAKYKFRGKIIQRRSVSSAGTPLISIRSSSSANATEAGSIRCTASSGNNWRYCSKWEVQIY